MTPRHWWIGVAVIVLAVLAHAAFPRYDWRPESRNPWIWVRIDRWTGNAEMGMFDANHTQWTSLADLQREREPHWDLTGLPDPPPKK